MRIAMNWWWLRTLSIIFTLYAVQCVAVESNNIPNVPQTFKLWSLLDHLLSDTDPTLLTKLYAILFSLDDDMDNIDADSIAYLLKYDFDNPHIADLFQLYVKFYPMGMLTDDDIEAITIPNTNYYILNGKKYFNPDDVFYLKSSDLNKQYQSIDNNNINGAIIGKNLLSPIIKFYGCPIENSNFFEFNKNLYNEAISDSKFRFKWIPNCSFDDFIYPIDNFPISYTPIDENDSLEWDNDETVSLNIPDSLKQPSYKIFNKKDSSLSDLDLKVSTLLLNRFEKRKSIKDIIKYSKNIINNFLLLGNSISNDVSTTIDPRIEKSVNELKNVGVDYKLLGLYVNGQNIELTKLNSISLLSFLTKELNNIKFLKKNLSNLIPRLTNNMVKSLLDSFATISQINLQRYQPIKIDLHQINGFSESIIYFNDIEKDSQYKDLSNDISVFFEKSKYGEIPELRQNWNEIIFAINFDDLDNPMTLYAIDGLLRAVQITKEGYPQRIGLLPISTNNNILKSIYNLKDANTEYILQYLSSIIMKNMPHGHPQEQNIPNVREITDDLQIFDNSIIINGEIYPFLENNWRYLVTKVTKKDVAIMQKLLQAYGPSMKKKNMKINVRDLLHSKSTNYRNSKLTPNYFIDSDYTIVNNTALLDINDRIFEFVSDNKYNVLHTISLVGDIDSNDMLENLKNLLPVNLNGVRYRLINTGDITSVQWKKLKKFAENNDNIESLIKLISQFKPNNKKKVNMKNHLNDKIILKKWLPEISKKRLMSNLFITINGRFIHFDDNEILNTKQYKAILLRESIRTLDSIRALESILPKSSEEKIDPNFIESITSTLTKLFYQGSDIFETGTEFNAETRLSRLDFSQLLNKRYPIIFKEVSHNDKLIDILLIIDPLEERTQDILTIIDSFSNLSFLNIQIILLPTIDLKVKPIYRIYGNNNISSSMMNKSKELIKENILPSFFTKDLKSEKINGFEVIAYAFPDNEYISTSNVEGISGACLQIVDSNGEIVSKTTSMATFGYSRFMMNKLSGMYKIESCDPRFVVKSFSMDSRVDFIANEYISFNTFTKNKIIVKMEQISDELPIEDNKLHIFSVLLGENDEIKYKNMVLSILSKFDKNFNVEMSVYAEQYTQEFIDFVQVINNNNNESQLKIKFINYNWPYWLRPQRFIDRKLDASKVLFTDVMFDSTVGHIIYMEPNETPFDPFELYNTGKEKRGPYIMSRMRGKGYWDTGYWAKTLKEKDLSFYDISPGFMVDLSKIREYHYADKLRLHYQRLTSDIGSLQNIAQDLVNDLQTEVHISPVKKALFQPIKLDKTLLASLTSSIDAQAASLASSHRAVPQYTTNPQDTPQDNTSQDDTDDYFDEL